jgi:hypothetical protein
VWTSKHISVLIILKIVETQLQGGIVVEVGMEQRASLSRSFKDASCAFYTLSHALNLI